MMVTLRHGFVTIIGGIASGLTMITKRLLRAFVIGSWQIDRPKLSASKYISADDAGKRESHNCDE
jgi:hypothetical protein